MEPSLKAQLAELVREYKMPEQAKQLLDSADLMVISGVTAAGKDTLADKLIQGGGFAPVISHTTRAPRLNHGVPEQNGKEYWFVSDEELLALLKQEAFIEIKDIHGGTYYGKSIKAFQQIIDAGHRPILNIDVKGALELSKAVPSLKPIFLMPPSYDIWMERLGARGSMTDIERSRRLVSARGEIQTALRNPQFILVINHEVELTVTDVLRGNYKSPENQHHAHQLAMEFLQFLKSL